jgi:DNA-binding MarR family transcriptional regulator
VLKRLIQTENKALDNYFIFGYFTNEIFFCAYLTCAGTRKRMKSQLFAVDLEDPVQVLMAFPRLAILAGEVSVRAGDELIFKQFDLDVARWGILATLYQHGGQLSMTQLRDHTHLLRSPSNITQIVDAFEAHGILQRQLSPVDRRIWLVQMTDQGRAFVEKVLVRFQQVMEENLAQFDIEEVRTAILVLIKWIWQCGEAAGLGHMKTGQSPFDAE